MALRRAVRLRCGGGAAVVRRDGDGASVVVGGVGDGGGGGGGAGGGKGLLTSLESRRGRAANVLARAVRSRRWRVLAVAAAIAR
jgi:hypothetical protein